MGSSFRGDVDSILQQPLPDPTRTWEYPEGPTCEILREQLDNIPSFAAVYFEHLLEKREKSNFDPAEWGSKVDDCSYNHRAFKEQEPPEKEKSQTPVKEETPVTALESSEEKKEEENAAVKSHLPGTLSQRGGEENETR
uniref:Sperm surface protein Sp17 n=1 Tax=Molossus molossus TaxID=27622 RepID=A0A7J8HZZ0_MOLMO|nr:hypothetical protein HJG59_010819 [Molossus molossus]